MTDNYPYMLIVSYGFRFVKYILHKVVNILFQIFQNHLENGETEHVNGSAKKIRTPPKSFCCLEVPYVILFKSLIFACFFCQHFFCPSLFCYGGFIIRITTDGRFGRALRIRIDQCFLNNCINAVCYLPFEKRSHHRLYNRKSLHQPPRLAQHILR